MVLRGHRTVTWGSFNSVGPPANVDPLPRLRLLDTDMCNLRCDHPTAVDVLYCTVLTRIVHTKVTHKFALPNLDFGENKLVTIIILFVRYWH